MKKAVNAGNEAIERARSKLVYNQKDYKEFVTNCDVASENAIVKILKKEFPESKIYSEELYSKESDEMTGREELIWVIDPLDGTHNFLHKIPFYAISIGVYMNGKPFAGMIYIPKFYEYFYAIKDKGSFLNDKKISTSNIQKLSNSMIAYDNQFHKHEAMLKNLNIIQDKCFTLRIFGSATIDMCKVAQGAIEARIFHNTKFVDFAAGIIIVEEAGGKVTNFEGKNVNSKTRDLIVSNGKIHKELIELLHL